MLVLTGSVVVLVVHCFTRRTGANDLSCRAGLTGSVVVLVLTASVVVLVLTASLVVLVLTNSLVVLVLTSSVVVLVVHLTQSSYWCSLPHLLYWY